MTAVEPATILLVEDDAPLAADVVRAFSEGPHTIWHAETAADARAMLRQRHPDLIILDLTLPDVDGLVFCAHFETEAPNVPFMVCSTGTTAEKVLSFKLGAEDFVAKPFEFAELEARVEAILRRRALAAIRTRAYPVRLPQTPSGPPSAVAGRARLRVDLARARVMLDGKSLDLTPTEFHLLAFMAHRQGEIISRQELAREVWGDESMSRSRTIDAYVRRISSKLVGEAPPRILSIRGLGYQLAGLQAQPSETVSPCRDARKPVA